MRNPLDAIGNITTLLPANPVAGSNFTYTLPDNHVYKIVCITFRLVTDATVANRHIGVVFVDGAIHTLQLVTGANVIASTTVTVAGWQGLADKETQVSNVLTFGLPTDLYLEPGTVINSNIKQLQATDQVSQIQIYAHTWPTLNL